MSWSASNVATWVVSVLALLVSFKAWRLAAKSFSVGHRPLVRVVASVAPQIFSLGGRKTEPSLPANTIEIELNQVVLKNIGSASALTVVAFDPEDAAVIASVDLVEPLGAGKIESERIGRVTLMFQRNMTIGHSYELYYQSTLGEWHLTKFRPMPRKVECTFVGEVKKVPDEVEPLGTVLES
jgi:hypothetical protein